MLVQVQLQRPGLGDHYANWQQSVYVQINNELFKQCNIQEIRNQPKKVFKITCNPNGTPQDPRPSGTCVMGKPSTLKIAV